MGRRKRVAAYHRPRIFVPMKTAPSVPAAAVLPPTPAEGPEHKASPPASAAARDAEDSTDNNGPHPKAVQAASDGPNDGI